MVSSRSWIDSRVRLRPRLRSIRLQGLEIGADGATLFASLGEHGLVIVGHSAGGLLLRGHGPRP